MNIDGFEYITASQINLLIRKRLKGMGIKNLYNSKTSNIVFNKISALISSGKIDCKSIFKKKPIPVPYWNKQQIEDSINNILKNLE